jgi:hypothetical protein
MTLYDIVYASGAFLLAVQIISDTVRAHNDTAFATWKRATFSKTA